MNRQRLKNFARNIGHVLQYQGNFIILETGRSLSKTLLYLKECMFSVLNYTSTKMSFFS